MVSFLALYRGKSLEDAQLVAVSTHPRLLAVVTRRLLVDAPASDDPAVRALQEGRRKALTLIEQENGGGHTQ